MQLGCRKLQPLNIPTVAMVPLKYYMLPETMLLNPFCTEPKCQLFCITYFHI